MKTIHKFTLMPGRNIISLPYEAQFLSFGLDGSSFLCAWFLINKEEVIKQSKEFEVVGAGWDLNENDFFAENFLGTTTQEVFVWHLFRV